MKWTINELIRLGTDALASKSDAPYWEAESLIAHVLNRPRSFLKTWPEMKLNESTITAISQLFDQRARGYPFAYLVGYQPFWSLDFSVDESVLIPRTDTECIVETVLAYRQKLGRSARLLDLGTGCGAIAIALAFEKPDWHIDAIDVSDKALNLARRNAAYHGVSNVTFSQSDWFECITGYHQYDAIVANPPYIADDDPHLAKDVAYFEPALALYGGNQGLAIMAQLIQSAPDYLKPDARLFVEHGAYHADGVTQLFQQSAYKQIISVNDRAGYWRITHAKAP